MVVNIAFYENVFFILSLFRIRELTPAPCKSYLAPRSQRPAPRNQHPANLYTHDKSIVNPVVSYVNDYRSSLTALAIYTRSPSSYTAVRDLNILQLPCIDILIKCIKKTVKLLGSMMNIFSKSTKGIKHT